MVKTSKKRLDKQYRIPFIKLEELYKVSGGRLSHFIFLKDEPQDFIDALIEQGFVKLVMEDTKMFVVTTKLISEFRDLTDVEKLL